LSTPSYSFVIPVLNEEEAIELTLSSLAASFPDGRRIVVDGGSTDETLSLAEQMAHSLLTSEAGRSRQMNAGAQSSDTHYLLFLHADSLPLFDQTVLYQALSQSPMWGFCGVRLSGRAVAFRIIEWFMNIRSQLTGIATGDQMLFVRRDVFEELGGFADIPLMEDIEICNRLRAQAKPLRISGAVHTSSRRWETRGIVTTVLQMWWLRLAFYFGASPQRLWRSYYGR